MVCIKEGLSPGGMETGGSSEVLDGVMVKEDGRLRGESVPSSILESKIETFI